MVASQLRRAREELEEAREEEQQREGEQMTQVRVCTNG
jgi:hypothetical protein